MHRPFNMPFARLVAIAGIAAAMSGAARADAPAADGFTAKAEVVAKSDGPVVSLTIDVAPEYHWNNEYPAKVEVIGDLPNGVRFDKRIAKATDGGITATPQQARAELAFARDAGAKGSVTVQARFSICNDRVCLMKSAKLAVDAATR